MKKRTLKRQAREAEKKILEKNQEWFNSFIQENYTGGLREQRKKQDIRNGKLKAIWISLSSVVAAAAIVITLVFMWPLMFPGPDPDPPAKYLVENEVFVASDFIEVNKDLQGFFIKLDTEYESDVFRTYDSVSGDTLHYKATVINEETIETIIIYAYVNPYYENRKELTDLEHSKIVSVGGFIITYNKEVTDDDWALVLTYRAIAKYNNFIIYIEYEQLSLDEEGNFFNFFEQTFQAI